MNATYKVCRESEGKLHRKCIDRFDCNHYQVIGSWYLADCQLNKTKSADLS